MAMQHLEHEEHHPDAWHQHESAEGMPQDEHGSRVNALGVGIVLAGLGVVVVVTAILTVVYLRAVRADLIIERQLTTQSRATFEAYRAQQEAELENYGWANRNEGYISIPIDQAKAKVLEAYDG